MGVGIRLKTILRNRNLTIKQLSEQANVPLNTLYSITKRDSERVDPVILQCIASALGVPVNDLLGQEEPDREYEYLCDTLTSVGLSIEAAGYGEGPDEGGDHYYVWHTDSEDPEAERAELTYRDLLRIVAEAQKSADLRRIDYLRKRLDAELF